MFTLQAVLEGTMMNVLRLGLRNAVLMSALGIMFLGASVAALAQAPGGRGRGLPGATPEQTQAVADMNTALEPQAAAVTAARAELATVTYANTRNEAGFKAAVEKLRTAELALATARAAEFAKIQAGPNKLSPEQVTALIAAGGNPATGRGPGFAPPAAPTANGAR
jgi:hypothetical protein